MTRQKLTPEQEALIKQLIQTLQTQRPERIDALAEMLAEEEPSVTQGPRLDPS